MLIISSDWHLWKPLDFLEKIFRDALSPHHHKQEVHLFFCGVPKISQTFHNRGVHLSSSTTTSSWQYWNAAKLRETEKHIEHAINSNLELKVVSLQRCCGPCLHLDLVFDKLRIVEIHYLTNPVRLQPSQE